MKNALPIAAMIVLAVLIAGVLLVSHAADDCVTQRCGSLWSQGSMPR